MFSSADSPGVSAPATAIAAGVASWLILQRWMIRADYTLAAIALASVANCYLRWLTLGELRTGALYIFSLLLCTTFYRLSPLHPLAAFPGPVQCRLSSVWLTYVSYCGQRYLVLDRLHAKYGPFVRIAPNLLSVNSRSAVVIYTSNFEKSNTIYRVPFHGRHVVSMFLRQKTNDVHRARKQIWNQLFTSSSLVALIHQVDKRSWQLLSCMERRTAESPDGTIDLGKALAHWAYDIMSDMVFGGSSRLELMATGDPEGIVPGNKVATYLLDSLGITPWILDLAWNLPTTKELHALRKLGRKMINLRVNSNVSLGYRDLASYLLEAGIPPEDLDIEACTGIIGGADQNYIILEFALYYLIAHPEDYKRLQDDLDEAFPDPSAPLSISTLASMPFLNAVIDETLRLTTPVYAPRVVPPGGLFLEGRFIPAGAEVALATYSQQTSPENFFPRPLDWCPARWLPGGLGPETKADRLALLSFLHGDHACIGKPAAYQHIRHVLARILLHYDLSFVEGFDVPGFRSGMMHIRTVIVNEPLRVRIKRRPGVDLDAFLR